ncbi:MAG: peptidase [Slackia sp.]|uniref:coiled-coil domain-containing protein n=1 Tax=uncultured Slackia sp. TaxID=665903 RepID=UPI0028043244|nr:peptidase [uncultured Slackia sp.]MDU6010736.1 peptidase [Slackia sp.]
MGVATSIVVVPAAPAFATSSVADARTSLDQAESRLADITKEYDDLQAQVDDLQTQIDDATAGVLDAQDAAQKGREKLGESAQLAYKTGGISLLDVVLSSQSLDEFIDNAQYVLAVQDAQADIISRQRSLEAEYQAALEDLGAKKDLQIKKLNQAADKSAEAQQVVDSAQAQLKDAQDAEAESERLAKLQEEAKALAAAQAASASSKDAVVTSNDSTGSSSSSPSTSSSSSNAGSSSSNTPSSSDGWHSGEASAYGSTSDGTLGEATATGAIVTQSSMGVAVSMSMPNYRDYLGRSVEISYGGRTVVATVNDCGGFGGSRVLDLQPGVWSALGASSCEDWGVRTVSYRFL